MFGKIFREHTTPFKMANSILVTKTNVIQDYVGMESPLVLEWPNK